MEDGDVALLEVRDLWKTYAVPGQDQPVDVLKGINLRVSAGDTVGILGPSGSGKSTLLNLIGALDRPSRGTVCIGGRDLAGMNERQLAELRNAEIGFVFQLHHLLPQCSALENVLVPTLAYGSGRSTAGQIERAKELLRRVGLEERQACVPARLSGGERQRVAVVRALINRPRLLLADEPTGALDAASARSLGDLLIELNAAAGTTLVVVTHSLALAERLDRVFELRSGVLHCRAGGGSA